MAIHEIIRGDQHVSLRMSLDQGTILAKIGPAFAGRTFRLHMADTQIVASGTAFAVHRESQEQFVIELVSGGLTIIHGASSTQIAANEYLRVRHGQDVETGTMGLARIHELTKELGQIPPAIPMPLYKVSDLSAEIFLPKKAPRVQDTMSLLVVKLQGQDAKTVKSSLDAILTSTDMTKKRAWSDMLMDYFVSHHPHEDYSPQILLVLASHFVQERQYEVSLSILDNIVHLNHHEWSSLAQCQKGLIHEERLHDPAKAKEAYQKVLDQFPVSVDTKDAQMGLERLSLPSRPEI